MLDLHIHYYAEGRIGWLERASWIAAIAATVIAGFSLVSNGRSESSGADPRCVVIVDSSTGRVWGTSPRWDNPAVHAACDTSVRPRCAWNGDTR